MADEQKPKARKKPSEPKAEGGAVAAPATTEGAPKGKKAPVAATVAAAPAHPQTKSLKVPKLQKKNKSRLPRRQKKAHQKVTASQSKA